MGDGGIDDRLGQYRVLWAMPREQKEELLSALLPMAPPPSFRLKVMDGLPHLGVSGGLKNSACGAKSNQYCTGGQESQNTTIPSGCSRPPFVPCTLSVNISEHVQTSSVTEEQTVVSSRADIGSCVGEGCDLPLRHGRSAGSTRLRKASPVPPDACRATGACALQNQNLCAPDVDSADWGRCLRGFSPPKAQKLQGSGVREVRVLGGHKEFTCPREQTFVKTFSLQYRVMGR